MFKTFALALMAVTLAAGCTITTTNKTTPVFDEGTDKLQASLNKLVTFEDVNIDGSEVTNGKAGAELEIDVINGQNIPADKNKMNDMARQIAIVVKDALDDKDQFESYKVLFVTKKITKGLTEKTWRGKVFKLGEL